MHAYTEDDITIDPLIVLRCDDRVFRIPALMEITLRTLEAFLQASKCYLANHIQVGTQKYIIDYHDPHLTMVMTYFVLVTLVS